MNYNAEDIIKHVVKSQIKIRHFQGQIFIGTPSQLKLTLKNNLKKQYGDIFLSDTDYILIAKANNGYIFKDKDKEKFANLIYQSLGKKVPITEIKTFENNNKKAEEEPEEPEEPEDQDNDKVDKSEKDNEKLNESEINSNTCFLFKITIK